MDTPTDCRGLDRHSQSRNVGGCTRRFSSISSSGIRTELTSTLNKVFQELSSSSRCPIVPHPLQRFFHFTRCQPALFPSINSSHSLRSSASPPFHPPELPYSDAQRRLPKRICSDSIFQPRLKHSRYKDVFEFKRKQYSKSPRETSCL